MILDEAFLCQLCGKISPVNWWWPNDDPSFSLADDEEEVACKHCWAEVPFRVCVTVFGIDREKLKAIMDIRPQGVLF